LKCIVCDREAKEKYCMFHEEAYHQIAQKFLDWNHATGAGWKQYLKELVENAYTGCWAKEVAESLLKSTDG
jgi:hypothetical protein